jgi:L-2-hydroxyglutarate oxidase LhgO
MEQDQIAALEPNIFALKALYSPTTGIVDTHSLMKRLETNILNQGGQVAYGSEVTGIRKIEGGYEISLLDADKKNYSFTSAIVINSAGLSSDKISEMVGIKDERLTISFCKGEYFQVKPPKNRLISRLVYPVPHTNMEGIGIHVTVDMGGGVKLGPDVTYLESNVYDYHVDPSKQEAFWRSAKKFLPFLEYNDIIPEMAGIRPKTQKKGEPIRDFYIMEESARGNPGFINLIGMESPGMTSCLSIADYVSRLIRL